VNDAKEREDLRRLQPGILQRGLITGPGLGEPLQDETGIEEELLRELKRYQYECTQPRKQGAIVCVLLPRKRSNVQVDGPQEHR